LGGVVWTSLGPLPGAGVGFESWVFKNLCGKKIWQPKNFATFFAKKYLKSVVALFFLFMFQTYNYSIKVLSIVVITNSQANS
jgi:hypothetical protein